MAKKAELKAVLSMDMSPFARGAAKALATGKALAAQFARNPVKLLATGAFLGAEKAIGAIGRGVGKLPGMVMGGLGKLAKYGGIAAAALSAGVLEAMNYGRGLKQMSDKTGITVGRLAMMKRVLGDNGIEVEQLGSAMKKLDVNLIGSLKSGGTDAFQSIGLFAKDLIKLDPGERLLAVGKAIAGLSDSAAQSAAAVHLLGKNGTEMLGMFHDTEGMAAAGGPLSKQAQLLDKNAKIFNQVINNLRHAGAKMRGFFVGVASEVANVVNTLTEGAGKLDFVEMGQKLGVALKDAMKWGFALWEDPKGVMGYFWEVAKTKALELANWLHDAVEGAFPGMAVAIEDAISKTIAWGKILVGYAVQFGETLVNTAARWAAALSAAWEATGIPGFIEWMKKTAPNKAGWEMGGQGGQGEQDEDNFVPKGWDNRTPEMKRAVEIAKGVSGKVGAGVIPGVGEQGHVGSDLVAEGMAQLAKNAKGAADALESAKVGADHFGAKAQAEKAEAMRNKIEPALKKANAKMAAIGGGPEKAKRWQSLVEWRNQQIRNQPQLVNWAVWPKMDLNAPAMRVGGLLSHREMEGFRTRAAAQGIASLDGVATRRPGEVHAGDAARKRAFDKDQERKRLGNLTEAETLDEMLKVAKDARDANQKVAIAIAQ